MHRDRVIYRPPMESDSIIIQLTYGCAHNQCTFCTMYKNVNFKVRKFDDILNDLMDERHK